MKKLLIGLLVLVLPVVGYCSSYKDLWEAWNKMPHAKSTTVELTNSNVINAYTYFLDNGKYKIVFTTGLLRFTTSQELALVVGHEIGHSLYGMNEDTADEYGARMAKAAGYDVCQGRNFFYKLWLKSDRKKNSGDDGSHSAYTYRYDHISKIGGCRGTSATW